MSVAAAKIEKIVAEDLDIGIGKVSVMAPTGGTMQGNRINLSSFANAYTFSWAPGSIANGAYATTGVTVVGARMGNPVMVSIDAAWGPGAYDIDARVMANDTVYVSFRNESGVPITVGTLTWRILVFVTP